MIRYIICTIDFKKEIILGGDDLTWEFLRKDWAFP